MAGKGKSAAAATGKTAPAAEFKPKEEEEVTRKTAPSMDIKAKEEGTGKEPVTLKAVSGDTCDDDVADGDGDNDNNNDVSDRDDDEDEESSGDEDDKAGSGDEDGKAGSGDADDEDGSDDEEEVVEEEVVEEANEGIAVEISTPGALPALLNAGQPVVGSIIYSGAPSVRQASLIVREADDLANGLVFTNLTRLRQVHYAGLALDRLLSITIPTLKSQPDHNNAKRYLRLEAQRVHGAGRMVGGDFGARADALHADLVYYSYLVGQPRNAPALNDLRTKVNQLINAPVVF